MHKLHTSLDEPGENRFMCLNLLARFPRACLLLVGATAVTAALGASASIDAAQYYAQLRQTAWAPPSSVFGPVWSVLYLMMALASCLVVARPGPSRSRPALGRYAFQLVLNAGWSWLFFRLHSGFWAMVDVVALLIAIVVTAVVFGRVRAVSCWLLLPYIGWVAFASALTWSVWQLNPLALGQR